MKNSSCNNGCHLRMIPNIRHRRRRTALLAVLACTAALSLQSLLSPQLIWDAVDHATVDDTEDEEDALLMEEMKMEDHFRRKLFSEQEEISEEDAELLSIPGEDAMSSSVASDGSGQATIASSSSSVSKGKVVSHTNLIDTHQPLPSYTIEDAIRTTKMYEHTFALLVYDPTSDSFLGLYSKRHYWVSGCEKLLSSFRQLAYLLRKIFPERFQGKNSKELVIPISSGDSPGVKAGCLDHFRKQADNPRTPPGWRELVGLNCDNHIAPVLHFGSVFRQPHLFPSMIAMPMPVASHLNCFETWATHKIICKQLRSITSDEQAELVYGEDLGLEWKDLIPQVVWRGTDFSYLTKVYPILQKPEFKEKLVKWPWSDQAKEDWATNEIGGGLTAFAAAKKKRKLERVRKRHPRRAAESDRMLMQFSKAAAVKAMKGQYENLLPRWKAVVLTAEAEVNAEEAAAQEGSPANLPWANMKFSNYINGGSKSRTQGEEHYKEWEDIDFPATGNYMGLRDLAQYKYHVDLGGGGGTTWSGTIQKLAMPGLLFHHMTPTKDYIHDYMKPWTHYIPISSDLHDLKRKYNWAESHPVESKQIADEGTKLMRYLTSPEGFEDMFQQDMVEPLRRVIEAYQPISTVHPQPSWKNWREATRQIEGDEVLVPVIECGGWSVHCKPLLGKKYITRTLSHRNKRGLYGGS